MKKIPKFKDETAERDFWQKNDSSAYVNWKKPVQDTNFINLKPSIKSISIRLPETMLNDIKVLANRRDIPYQSLMKMFLSEKIKDEFKGK